QLFLLQPSLDLTGGWNDKRVDLHMLALEDSRRGAEVRHLAARTGANVRAVELGALDLGNIGSVVGAVRFGDNRFEFGYVVDLLVAKTRPRVALDDGERLAAVIARPDVVQGHIIRGNDAVLAAGFDDHVAQGHALFNVQ